MSWRIIHIPAALHARLAKIAHDPKRKSFPRAPRVSSLVAAVLEHFVWVESVESMRETVTARSAPGLRSTPRKARRKKERPTELEVLLRKSLAQTQKNRKGAVP